MKWIKQAKIAILIGIQFFCYFSAQAVPFSFLKSYSGNLRDLNWHLLETPLVQVYYDQNAKAMGKYALNSIEISYPYLSYILGVSIGDQTLNIERKGDFIVSNYPKIVLILGDRVEGPGFANPATQNIEAQMIHPRNASFFQHELVHRLMYEHNDIHLGAPGRLFSLAMMPTWWIEGLAEYLTESSGRVKTEGFLRTMSIQHYWPTWERLHSLYNGDGDNNLRGYITSGRFLGWIFSQAKEKNLAKIQEQIANKTTTPFFYKASDNWLKENLDYSGKELYDSFKKYEQNLWTNELQQMPSLLSARVGEFIFKEDRPYKIFSNNRAKIIAKLNELKTPQKSSFVIFNGIKIRRVPISIYGSSLFAIEDENDSILATTHLEEFSNSSYGTSIELIKFNGNIFDIKDEKILARRIIPLANQTNPFIIEEIQSVGHGLFYIHASLRGNSYIFLLDSNKGSYTKVAAYEFPMVPKFLEKIPNSKNSCLLFILDEDKEQTSIQKICGTSRQLIFAKNQLNILEGIILKNNVVRLLVSWDKILALVDIKDNKVTSIGAFPDWISHISSEDIDGNFLSAWVYDHGEYKLYKINTNNLRNNFKNWQIKKNKNAIYTAFPKFNPYKAPYEKVYEQKNLPPTIINVTPIEKKVKEKPAIYDRNFLFAFPYALPNILGGPSVNLLAIPYQDKMERDQIQISGGYNFYLQAPSGTISYLNRRLFDGFALSLFAAPFFNGIYEKTDNQGNIKKYYNYLLQEGVSLANLFYFRPSSFSLEQVISLIDIQPYSHLENAPTAIGAQKTTLFSVTENLSFNLFKTGFYLTQEDELSGNNAIWTTNLGLEGGKFNSIQGSKDTLNHDSGNLDYHKLSANLTSRLSFNKHSFTLTGKISTTQGQGTFNLKEYYSPYQTYILGSTTSLNYVSYPFLATTSLFNLQMGYWSGQSSLNYEFPIFENFESLFLMSYVSDWHGILSVSEGGVSQNKDMSNFDKVTTLSLGTTCTIDIKGFQIYPSLFYSQLLEKNGWGIIMQLKFMDFM